jgi:hypothetical protein
VRSVAGYLWLTYHSAVGATYTTYLNSDSASVSSSSWWNNTAPTSSVFTVGNSNYSNASGATYVAYCWTPIAGFSSFGSYSGNSSASGPFLYTGFRPKWLMIKISSGAADDWYIYDSARNTYNTETQVLWADLSDAEYTYTTGVDFLSNGFRLTSTGAGLNTSGRTYIYIAFAENPFKNALAR